MCSEQRLEEKAVSEVIDLSGSLPGWLKKFKGWYDIFDDCCHLVNNAAWSYVITLASSLLANKSFHKVSQ